MTITVLDGGMGREPARIGAPFRQPEWSALALLDGAVAAVPGLPLGAYANAFPEITGEHAANEGLLDIRASPAPPCDRSRVRPGVGRRERRRAWRGRRR